MQLNMDTRKSIAYVMFFFSLFLKSHLSIGADTISADQFLSGDKTIVSSNGIFELGFFKPGKSSNYYIGIWYKNISPQTVVWVANREAPVLDKYSAELKIIDGNLVLIDVSKTKTSIWSTNINSIASNSVVVVAVLLNDGDLILRTSSTIWQSFDYPTDTWLPDGKLLFDRRVVKKALTSWKNLEDPAPGLFSYNHEPNGSKSFLSWNATQQYWTSGFWNFYVSGLSPQMRNSQIFNYSYVNNENEGYGYFTYYPHDPSSISRFVLDTSGQFNLLNWSRSSKEWTLIWSQPKEQCDVYAYCGAFGICNQNSRDFCACSTGFEPKSYTEWDLKDFSGGCVRKTDLQCRSNPNGKKDNFFMYENMRLPQDTQSLMINAEECESVCLSNCSCLAYGYSSGMCSIWTADLLNLVQLSQGDVNGRTILIRLAASEFHNAKSRKAILIGAIAALFVLSGLILMAFWWWRRRIVGFSKAVEGSLVAFNFNDLQHATKNFSERLGGGGFGSVFKGTMHDSSVIAVKKLESISQGEKQFRAEVSTLGTIHHVNLVRLRGFCSQGRKKLLVYDYMENGSLDYHLFSTENNSSLVVDWKTRYQIALGAARGLSYLHEKCRDYIIHSDIKPENILLDDKFCAKLADFGLAKLVGRDFSRVLTSIRGTKGYLAPEWLSGVAITTKADVYSYGMVLFELISGRRNFLHCSQDVQVDYFPSRAAGIIVDGGDIMSLLDHRLDKIADPEEVSRMCKVALWCIQEDEDRRPSMGQVIQILEGVLDVNVPPAPLLSRIFDLDRSSTSLMKVMTSNV